MKLFKCVFIVLFLLVTTVSCKKHYCFNKIQDGEETGVDCGGKCVPCSTVIDDILSKLTPRPEMLKRWHLHKMTLFSESGNSHTYLVRDTGRTITLTNEIIWDQDVSFYKMIGNVDLHPLQFERGYFLKLNDRLVVDNELYSYKIIGNDTLILTSLRENASNKMYVYTPNITPYSELSRDYRVIFNITSNVSDSLFYLTNIYANVRHYVTGNQIVTPLYLANSYGISDFSLQLNVNTSLANTLSAPLLVNYNYKVVNSQNHVLYKSPNLKGYVNNNTSNQQYPNLNQLIIGVNW